MRQPKPVFYSTAIAANLLIAAPSLANCNDMVGSLEYFQPAMERLWQDLQTRTEYPWGDARPYGELMGDRIILTHVFDDLDGEQKVQVIDLLQTNGYGGLYNLLTEEEKNRPGIGALPPYEIFAHDGRLVTTAYDGCTLVRLLTERTRYSYYYNRLPVDPNTGARATYEDLRNAGQPFWRDVQFPISAEDERAVRLTFWSAVGADKENQGWWIAWVPEGGYFEINVPKDYNPADLQRFWRISTIEYHYRIVATDGTELLRRW
ncbi:MAG: phosphoribosylaminoimidazolesuccinocarboxamide synthase [Cyanobacteria bacterium J06626_18]